ncbi:Arc family DNA-binding protein [Allomesorhizobium camelthorni]|uniref:Arc family DNA-binding protein n=1 Tax=Allomesorhizobium camelthorni TaxID=475069 RepID=A0A6G4W4T8_9HYPH|nr:Arc family DNA-binding protein [Mesorhizobium camelthorni]NGO49752.1 Arc family DNA-binding protein [Mesorhizobium camelthorni]
MIADAQMKIRLPHLLKEQIEAAARDSNRSLNGEIVFRLEASFGFRSPGQQPTRRAIKRAANVTLSEDDYDYIAGKVLARLRRLEE